jgi:LysR family glycine cleavage system transcriptional activator
VALTAAGERLARAAGEAMNLLRAALSDLREQDDGVLAITTLQSFATQWLAPRLGAFQIAHPKIAVRLDTSSQVIDIRSGGFDVALRSGSGDWPGLESQHLFSSAKTPLCAPPLRAALGGLSTPLELLTAPLIGAHQEWAGWFVAAGVDAPVERTGARLVADLQTIEVGSAVSAQGVALGAPRLYAREIAEGRLVRPFETSVAFNAGYWLAYARDRRCAPKIVAFREWLMGCVADEAAAIA